MIDFHSHILPGIDDGSDSPETSVKMLLKMAEQGIDAVVATPHCYMHDSLPKDFLIKRDYALFTLKEYIADNCKGTELPKIIAGAEVYYHSGISQCENLESLCIEGTKLLLLEMQSQAWGESVIRELEELSRCSGMKIVLAHIERFLEWQKPSVWERLISSGIIMQSNAEFFLENSRRRAIKMLKKYQIHVLGSDAHNLTTRVPNVADAYEYIEKKLGRDFVEGMDADARFLLKL